MVQRCAFEEPEQRAAASGADRACDVGGRARRSVRFVASSRIPTRWGTFIAHSFVDSEHKEHLVMTLGELTGGGPVLTRIHSECLTGDALFSLRCDCGHQLRSALQRIGSEGRGAVLYLRQEGRGIGLHNKIRAYGLQDCGADTVDANLRLGFSADAREYAVCGPMLTHIGVRRLRLMTNNPAKSDALTAMGFEVVERVSLPSGRNAHNAAYLDTKACRMGHLFDLVGENIGAGK